MEAINDSSRLVAKSIELLREVYERPNPLELHKVKDVIDMLEIALNKLVEKI